MSTRPVIVVLVAGLALTGCAAATNYSALGPHDQLLPKVAASQEQLPSEVYLDGTGPVAAYQSANPRPAVRRASTGTVATARPAQPSTDGVSSVSRSADLAPFTPEWWERENREDERLRRRMHICQGC